MRFRQKRHLDVENVENVSFLLYNIIELERDELCILKGILKTK